MDYHNFKNATVTATAVRPPARFGHMEIDSGLVTEFGEKNQLKEGWINGGFFILNRSVVDYINDESEPFETGALVRLTEKGKFYAYKHYGFWFPMDTRSEQKFLSSAANENPRPWKQF